MEEKQEHPYITSFRHFLTVYGAIGLVVTALILTGKLQGAWSWQGSQEVATNMDYQGPTWSPHKK